MKNLKFKILRTPPLVPTLCVGMPYFDALRRNRDNHLAYETSIMTYLR